MNEADPRVKRTHKLLHDSLSSLLAERSFHAITVRDIAERANVNRATFYHHFEDKHVLLDSLVLEWFQQKLRRRVSTQSSFNLGDLRVVIVTVLESVAGFHGCKKGRDIYPLVEAKLQKGLQEFIMEWMGQHPAGGDPPQTPQETVATVLSWAIFGAGIEWCRGPRTISADELGEQVQDLLTHGLSIDFVAAGKI